MRQLAPAIPVALLLGACGTVAGVDPAAVPRQDYLGSVAAGEPNAALTARDILKAGGSAADAAAALALTLAVTMPSRASLWAGGACLVHDPEDGDRRVYSFIHPESGDGEAPPPMLVRGMALMHAAHGRLRWGAVPAAAERLALLGHPVSRALARDIEAAPDRAAAVLAGGHLREGELLAQPELARTLGRVRLGGPGALHAGPLADALVRGAVAAGYRLDAPALERALPSRREPLSAEAGSWRAWFPADEASGGPRLAALWPQLAEDDWIAGDAAPAVPARAGTEGMPRDGGTGFAVVDAEGLAVSCGVTMNALFGAGGTAAGTGIAIAAPRAEGAVDSALSPFLVVHDSGGGIRFAGAGPETGVGKTGLVAAVRCRERTSGGGGAACTAHADPGGAGLAVQVFGE